ncbi:hypothetical protein GCM10010440_66270 [Kitasatospora cinereorecta]
MLGVNGHVVGPWRKFCKGGAKSSTLSTPTRRAAGSGSAFGQARSGAAAVGEGDGLAELRQRHGAF